MDREHKSAVDHEVPRDHIENAAQPTSGFASKDKAALFLKSANQTVVLTAENNKRVLRKIDLVILPIILFVYFLQQLDKSTLAYASVFGLITDTNLVGNQYSWLGSVVYIAQLVMQPAIAYLLVRLPTAKFGALMVLCWGIVLTSMTASHNFTGLVTSRFFLGAFEASVAPTFIAITQMWWRREEQTVRTASWYAMNGVTNMIGSLMTYGLGHIKSPHLKSYQIIFMFCGLLTVAFSFIMAYFLPDSPVEAKFLKEDEKLVAVERLRHNNMGVISREWKWDHVKSAFLDLKTWFWFCLLFTISVPSGGISTFGPLIIKSFGFDKFETILFNIPFGAVQIVATLGGAFLATKLRRKAPVLVLLCIPPVIGCAMLYAIEHVPAKKAPLLVGYYFISVYPGITPLIYSWSAQNTAGDTKRKVTTGIMFVGQSAGNILGPFLYRPNEAPGYHRGLRSNMALFIVIIVLVVCCNIYLVFLNKSHAKRRVELGKPEHLQDKSMGKVQDHSSDSEADTQDTGVGERAFDDITDLENEDFIFVY